MNNIARLEQMRGNNADAEDLFRRALAIMQQSPESAGEVAGMMSNIGSVLMLRGRRAAARQMLGDALEAAARFHGADHPALIDIMVNAAAVELGDKRYAAAEEILHRALRIAEAKRSASSPLTATVLAGYATALRGLKRKQEAAEYERRSAEMLRSYRGAHTVDISEFGSR